MSPKFVLLSPEQQVAEAFRQCLRSGEWGDQVPGIHRLADEFQVGRPTVEKAIRMLVESGEIEPPLKGKPMRPGRPPAEERRGTLIVHGIPAGLKSSDSMHALHRLAEGMPGPVSFLEVPFTLPPAVQIQKIRPSGAEWILLAFYETEVGDTLHREGRRVINLGLRAASRLVPRVAIDAESIYRGAFRHAFAAGHTRVVMPLWRTAPDFREMVGRWVADEYRAAGLAHAPRFDLPAVDEDSVEALHHCIVELFRHTPPTALILLDLPNWIAVSSTLARLRLRIPEDVSVIMLTNIDEIRYTNPALARFQLPRDTHLRVVKRMMAEIEQGLLPESELVAANWVPGPSLAAPPRR